MKVKELIAQLILFSEPNAEVIIQWGHANNPLNNLKTISGKKRRGDHGNYYGVGNKKLLVLSNGELTIDEDGDLYA
jgi:hypothetical protein